MNDETIFKPIGKISMSIENVRKKKNVCKNSENSRKKFFFELFWIFTNLYIFTKSRKIHKNPEYFANKKLFAKRSINEDIGGRWQKF